MQQFNLAIPPLSLLVTPKLSNPFYTEQKIILATAFPKRYPRNLSGSRAGFTYRSPCPTTTAVAGEPQVTSPQRAVYLISLQR